MEYVVAAAAEEAVLVPTAAMQRVVAAAATSGKADWSVEARSAEWQCWSRAWNELIASLQ